MSKQLLQSLTGVGAVHAGDVLLRNTAYQLTLWSDDSRGSSDNASVVGHIDITGIQEAVVFAGPGSLILTIEDGRRLAFQLTSTHGEIVGRGWLT